MLPKEEGYAISKVTVWKSDSVGNILVYYHSNPFLDNHIYEVEFKDISTKDYSSNLIFDHIYTQTNLKGKKFLIFKYVVNHRSYNKSVLLSYSNEGGPRR